MSAFLMLRVMEETRDRFERRMPSLDWPMGCSVPGGLWDKKEHREEAKANNYSNYPVWKSAYFTMRL